MKYVLSDNFYEVEPPKRTLKGTLRPKVLMNRIYETLRFGHDPNKDIVSLADCELLLQSAIETIESVDIRGYVEGVKFLIDYINAVHGNE